MKIYVITKGYYSDYHIITATTDKKLAKELAKKFTENGYGEKTYIEEYENAEIYLRKAYFVRFAKNGNVIELNDCSANEYYIKDVLKNEQCAFDSKGNIYITVFADNAEQAVKIANEKRAMFLAKKSGIC